MLRVTSRFFAYFTAVPSLLLAASGASAVPANKCVVDGTVTYQQGPCPSSNQVRKVPTLEELNAVEKKRRAAAVPSVPTKVAPAAPAAPADPAPANAFSCDGRRYCSQMRSCTEAKYFLANCPGVKMDGDRDGIPCEEQWCPG